MISFISGILENKALEYIVIDCRGIGYNILIPTNFSFSTKLIEGEPIKIDTYLHVKEDLMVLYGFESKLQKNVFTYLIKVSGISCKTAVKILSSFSTEELILAVKEGNTKKLTIVPGLGKKTTEKLIIELKDKFIKLFTNVYDTGETSKVKLDSNVMDAIEGLVALGFTQTEVRKVISSLGEGVFEKNTEKIIKECLSKLTSQ